MVVEKAGNKNGKKVNEEEQCFDALICHHAWLQTPWSKTNLALHFLGEDISWNLVEKAEAVKSFSDRHPGALKAGSC